MLTFAEENYLKTIFHLEYDSKAEVSTNSIAERLDTKASSVTDMVQKLAEKDLVNYTPYKGTTLTEQGKKRAANVIRRHRLWEVFLVEKLKFQWDEVHEIAEELEHIQSSELISRLDAFLDFPEFDPHGDPIPDKDGNIKRSTKILLSEAQVHTEGICVGVKESGAEFLQILDKKKIKIGSKIRIMEREDFDGSMTVQIDDEASFLSGKIAENVYIKSTEN